MITDSPQRQLQQACTALDRALAAGENARAETWLEACPALASDSDLALELIYSEYVAREAGNSPPTPSEYYERFPELADRLRRLFEVDEVFKPAATAADADTAAEFRKLAPAPAPRRIGPFEIGEKLGGGGMGVVYRARQTKPTRDVALKLLKSGTEAGALELARFRRESEAIARLTHPNIVTVYEVGESDGQPYLAMEYLPGGDLHDFVKARPQSAAWSAKLIASLARAVHYAHEHGIIHRDIKPANVLLAADATPKLTDFGLAALAGEAGLTRTGQVLGTLAYLAPEQAEATADSAKPGVDVYALGAVLYECLTGRPPVLAESEAEALNQILMVEPVPPRKLRPDLPRDLETIALKCLRKEPAKRYASALALAEDLERFQSGEPIQARPVGTLETSWKWMKRRPTRAALIGVSAGAITAILAITASYTSRLETTLNDKDAQRQRAEANARKAHEEQERAEANERAATASLAAEIRRRTQARAALDQLTERLLEEGTRSSRRNVEQMASLEAALKSYEELAADSSNDEASRVGVAKACWRAGTLANHLGRFAEAEDMIERSLAAWKSLQVEFPKNAECFRGYAIVLNDRGTMRSNQKKYAEAAADYRESLELQRLYSGEDRAFHKISLGTTALNLSLSHRMLKDDQTADECETVAIRLWEQFMADDPADQRFRNGLARCLQQRGRRLHLAGDRDAARADYQKALDLRIRDGKVTTIPMAYEEQATCHEYRAALAIEDKDTLAASKEYREALAMREQSFTQNPASNSHFQSLNSLLNTLYFKGDAYIAVGELEAACARSRPKMQVRALTEGDPTLLQMMGGLDCNHGNLLSRLSRFSDAIKAYDEGLAVLDRVLKTQGAPASAVTFYVNNLAGKASALRSLERYADGAKCLDQAIALEPSGPRQAVFRSNQAVMYARGGDGAKALASLDALESPPLGKLFLRAASYALVVEKCRDEDLRTQAEAKALVWLAKAREAGELKVTAYRDHLKTNADWAAMRSRHHLNELLDGPKK